jgi:hypothetical protein
LKYFVRFLWCSVVVLAACDEGEPVEKGNGEAYFPLRTGLYQIYSVDETIYTEFNPPEELSYELKTEVVDSFPNAEGGFTYVIYRSTRDSESDPWEFQETWSARINISQVVLSEGNVPFIRILLPVYTDKIWDGNELNILDEDLYEITEAGSSYQLEDGPIFSNCLVIVQENALNFLKRDEREEVYAKDVGLIYKKSIVLNYCDETDCFGQSIINDGVEYVQVLKEYGQN